MESVIAYTDGGARGNPGPAGAGAYLTDESGSLIAEVSRFLGTQTNNWAEYEAVLLALETLKKHFSVEARKRLRVLVRMDSELVARQLSGVYQIKEPSLFPQYIKVHNLLVKDFPNVSFEHVRREKNKEADRLANEAMDRGS